MHLRLWVVEQCADGVKNYDKTRIDCGGNCGSCALKSLKNNWIWLLVGVVVVLVVFCFGKVRGRRERYKKSHGFCFLWLGN